MIYYDVKPLSDLIKEFYELHKGSDYLDEQKAIQCWQTACSLFVSIPMPCAASFPIPKPC